LLILNILKKMKTKEKETICAIISKDIIYAIILIVAFILIIGITAYFLEYKQEKEFVNETCIFEKQQEYINNFCKEKGYDVGDYYCVNDCRNYKITCENLSSEKYFKDDFNYDYYNIKESLKENCTKFKNKNSWNYYYK